MVAFLCLLCCCAGDRSSRSSLPASGLKVGVIPLFVITVIVTTIDICIGVSGEVWVCRWGQMCKSIWMKLR